LWTDIASVFTWKDLTYTVANNKVLLNKVSGYCKAGTLTALMGSSGAGKTTLMDVLAQRKSEGEIKGEVLINGQALPVAFQRTTGYCEQVDVHLPQVSLLAEAIRFALTASRLPSERLSNSPRSSDNPDRSQTRKSWPMSMSFWIS
jgi:ABC-type multidrug transport system ATPase subunit